MSDCTQSDIIIIRHRKENLKKCSLRFLEENDPGRLRIYTYPRDVPSLPKEGIVLHMNGEELNPSRKGPLILLDGTWRYSEVMYRMTPALHSLAHYSIPGAWRTAYPRKQDDCADPSRGLATIEALYVACLLTGRRTDGVLDGYHWKAEFLELNRNLIA